MNSVSIRVELDNRERSEYIQLIAGMFDSFESGQHVMVAEMLKQKGYYLQNGFVLKDYLSLMARRYNCTRSEIKEVLRGENYNESELTDAGKIWVLNIKRCPVTLAKCEKLFDVQFDERYLSLDWWNIDKQMRDCSDCDQLVDVMSNHGVSGNLINQLKSKIEFIDDPVNSSGELVLDELPRSSVSKLRSIVHAIRTALCSDMPVAMIKALLICKGGLSFSTTQALLSSATGEVYNAKGYEAARKYSEEVKLPMDEMYEILQNGGDKDSIVELLKNRGLDDYQYMLFSEEADRSGFFTDDSPLDTLSIFMTGNNIDGDLTVIEDYKEQLNCLPKSSSLPFGVRQSLHATAHASANMLRKKSALKGLIVMSVLKGGADINTATLLNEGLYHGFSDIDGHKDTDASDARNILLKDDRLPILYLRSHIDDNKILAGSDKTFEMIVVKWFNQYGPVIALNNPMLSTSPVDGTYKLIIEGQDWRNIVVSTMIWSSYVIIRANSTDNLFWEIDIALQVVSLNRIIIIFEMSEPDSIDNDVCEYDIVRKMLLRHYPDMSLAENAPENILLTFGDKGEAKWFGDRDDYNNNPAKAINTVLDDVINSNKKSDSDSYNNDLERIKSGDVKALLMMEIMRMNESDSKDGNKYNKPKSRHKIGRIQLFAYISVILTELHADKYNAIEYGSYDGIYVRVPVKKKFLFFIYNSMKKIIDVECRSGMLLIKSLDEDGNDFIDEVKHDIEDGLFKLNEDAMMPNIKLYPFEN